MFISNVLNKDSNLITTGSFLNVKGYTNSTKFPLNCRQKFLDIAGGACLRIFEHMFRSFVHNFSYGNVPHQNGHNSKSDNR